jgi:hypothetical protein
MTDEELIETLRGRNGFGWTEDAADRIEQLVKETELLTKEVKLLEIGFDAVQAKLTKAVNVIKHILNIAPEGDEDEWHIALDDAAALLDELKEAE